MVTEGIDPPEYRYKYYAEAIRKLPDLFAESSTQIVIMNEIYHLQVFRQMWDEADKQVNIRFHRIEAVCNEAIVKERLSIGSKSNPVKNVKMLDNKLDWFYHWH